MPLGRLGADVRELLEAPADVRGAVRRVGRNVEWVERKLGRLLAPSQLIRRLSTSGAESQPCSLERAWGESGSPLLAAHAFLVARREGREVPEWVLQALEGQAEGQAEGLIAVAEAPRQRRSRQAISDALGLSNRTAWEAYTEWREQLELADAMADLVQAQEVHEDEAATEVAFSFGVSEDRAKHAYRTCRAYRSDF